MNQALCESDILHCLTESEKIHLLHFALILALASE